MRGRLIFRSGLPPLPPLIRSITPNTKNRREIPTEETDIKHAEFYQSVARMSLEVKSKSSPSSSSELPSDSSFVPIEKNVDNNIVKIANKIKEIYHEKVKLDESKTYYTLGELIKEVREELIREIIDYNKEIVERLENIDELVERNRRMFRESFSNHIIRYPRILALHDIITVLNDYKGIF